jgi:protein ImuB
MQWRAAARREREAASAREALEQLAAWCERFSPLVAVEDAEEPECLLMDITGLAELFPAGAGPHECGHDEPRSEARLALRIQHAFAALGYEPRVAVADTIGVAWAMARVGSACRAEPGSAEPHGASGPARQAGPTILPPGDTAWHALPVEGLRLSAETVSQLHKLGLKRIEQVAALPREALTSRFGEELLRRLDQASGRLKEVVRAQRPLPDWSAAWSPETPLASRQALEHVLAALVGRLADQLASAGQGAVELEVTLKPVGRIANPSLFSVADSRSESDRALAERVPHTTITLLRPTADPDHLMDLIRLRLERLRLAGPVTSVRVSVLQTAPLAWRQETLFAESRRDDARQLNLLVNRLSARLGRDRVLRPQPAASAQPERAFRLIPWTSVGDSLRESPAAGKSRRSRKQTNCETHRPFFQPLQRPLRLGPPTAIQAVSLANGPPAAFGEAISVQRSAVSLKSRKPSRRFAMAEEEGHEVPRHEIARHWGPETIQTGWWRGQSVQRDYYRVETTAGRRFWLFRRLPDGQWFLHGEFV